MDTSVTGGKSASPRGTFVVQIQYQQNATWQGKVQWVEENESKSFRSALELIKMMDAALERGKE